MASREDCDNMYKSIGLPGYSPEYSRKTITQCIQRMGDSISVSQGQNIMRCVALAETCDVDEYFDVSEFLTTPGGVESIIRPSQAFAVYLYHPNESNSQQPMLLSPIRPGGYTYNKYMRVYRYQAVPLSHVRQDAAYRGEMLATIGNLTQETIEDIIDHGQGYLIRPRVFKENEPDEWYVLLPPQTWLDVVFCRIWRLLSSSC